MTIPVILLPGEVQHIASAERWALATIRTNASFSPSAEPYGGTETGILDDQVWFAHYLVALARLTLEGRRILDAAWGGR